MQRISAGPAITVAVSGQHLTLAAGCIYANGNLTVSGASFTRNTSDWGGAIVGPESAVIIKDSTFSTNASIPAPEAPYPTYAFGGAAVLRQNGAQYGGGIANEQNLNIHHSPIAGNWASEDGGGIYNNDADVAAPHNAIFGNEPDNCVPVGSVPGCGG